MSKKLQGWVPPEKRSHSVNKQVDVMLSDMPLMTAAGRLISGTGKGKNVRLDQLLVKFAGKYPVVRQLIGDCVSFGWGKGIMLTLAADALMKGELDAWVAEICTEWLYGAMRNGPGRGQLRNSDGAVGIWAAKAIYPDSGHGMLLRQVYETPKGKVLDLTEYDGARAKSWGFKGMPWEMEEIADARTATRRPALVNSYEEARDAIANGYAVPVCSNQGFRDERDRDGCLIPSGRWAHCMVFNSSIDENGEAILGLDNSSWGNWVSGPNPYGLPIGCGGVHAEHADKMLRQNDSFAIPGINGFEQQDIDFSEVW